jgi:hypothetical protein
LQSPRSLTRQIEAALPLSTARQASFWYSTVQYSTVAATLGKINTKEPSLSSLLRRTTKADQTSTTHKHLNLWPLDQCDSLDSPGHWPFRSLPHVHYPFSAKACQNILAQKLSSKQSRSPTTTTGTSTRFDSPNSSVCTAILLPPQTFCHAIRIHRWHTLTHNYAQF